MNVKNYVHVLSMQCATTLLDLINALVIKDFTEMEQCAQVSMSYQLGIACSYYNTLLLLYLDINECSMRIHECPYPSKCINTPGSYMCKCPEGYNMVDDVCEGIFFV